MVKVSIIVPVYNTSKYLSRCIDSIINQTLDDIEIIIINDGSTDESHKIIEKYKDLRIKYYKRKNFGIGSSRNFGISKSSGEYICFVDSDDYLNSFFCEEMYNKCSKDNLDMCICDYYHYIENKQLMESYELLNFENTNLEDSPKLLIDINLSCCNKLYNRKLIVENNIQFPDNLKYEDISYVIKALMASKKIGKVNIPLYYFMVHDNAQMEIIDERMFDIFKILDIVYDELKDIEVLRKYLSYLIVNKVTTYILWQKYQKNRKIKNEFIDYGYIYMKEHIKNYKKSSYFKDINFLKALIKKYKFLSKLYCNI